MKISLIIAAAGAGKRFRQAPSRPRTPTKLFQDLAGAPLLARTLESFRPVSKIREVLLAVPPGTEAWVRKNILKRSPFRRVRLVPGGATRAESVWKALQKTSPECDWVAVHDGARPFPPQAALRELFGKSYDADAVILARPVVPTLKRVSPDQGEVRETVDRTNLFEAETPQLVRRSSLVKAYEFLPNALTATDEASLVESLGGKVKVVAHAGWNVKVTTPEDLRLAEAVYAGGGGVTPTPRIGFGKDTHRLVPGRKFYLGGLRIPFEKGALGHSDGDALVHAVADAVLGALGAGDIGDWFSDKNPRNKNIRSTKILGKVLDVARRRGWTPSQVDTVVLLEKPRLGRLKEKIRQSLAKWLNLDKANVSVKAKTSEGLGPEGEGRAVSCEAVVVLRKIS